MPKLLLRSTFDKISTIKNYQYLFDNRLQDFKFLMALANNHIPKISKSNLKCANPKKKQSQFSQSVQEGALKFVSEFNNSSIADYINLDSKTMFAPLYQLGIQPTLRGSRRFGDFEFFDAGKVSFLAKPRSLLWLSEALKNTCWRFK